MSAILTPTRLPGLRAGVDRAACAVVDALRRWLHPLTPSAVLLLVVVGTILATGVLVTPQSPDAGGPAALAVLTPGDSS